MSVMDELIDSKIVDFMKGLTAFAIGSEELEDVNADPFWPWPWP